MSIPVLSREAVREVDRRAIEEFGIPGLVLMENAGRGCADLLCSLGIAGPVIICCGKGNNAGDGLVIARHLELRGYCPRLLFWSDPRELTGDAGQNYQIARHAGLDLHAFSSPFDPSELSKYLENADWIVDALLGTGAQGEPRAPMGDVIQQLNACPARKLAIDIPSGIDCDSGAISQSTFRADHTGTFVAAKPGLLAPAAQPWVGQLHVLDIGVPRRLLAQFGLGSPS